MTFSKDEVIAMANEAGLNSLRIDPSEAVAVWGRFAALVAAKERNRIWGVGHYLDGRMRLQMMRWEKGQCFAAVTEFSGAEIQQGTNKLRHMAVDKMADQLELYIKDFFSARGQQGDAP